VSATHRVGIVGSSFGGSVHVPAFRAQGTFDVVALASPARAAAVAKERSIPNAFGSLEEMLDGVELDVVSVASPPFAHKAAVLAALARGKHVVCEKPFGLSVADCEEMVAAARAAGTVCALAHEFRYTPVTLAIKELIDNGHLGALRELEATWLISRFRAQSERPPSWWFERARGGGLTGAILSHAVDLTNWFAGRAPLRVAGLERTANPERRSAGTTFASDVADGAFAFLDYGAGLVGRVVTDGTRVLDSTTLSASGELRTVAASGPSILEMTTFAIDEEETAELEIRVSPHAKLAAAHPNLPPFVALLDRFADALAGRPADLPTFEDGLATQRVLEAVGYSTEA
jgi:predicted dehydrogenase